MSKTKYKEYVDRMLEAHKADFDAFKKLHDAYALDQDGQQDKFNAGGIKVLEIVNDWENKLCKQSEKGGYSYFTPKLAEKFREEMKKHFPFIDHIGLKVSYAPPTQKTEAFELKKITLR